MTARLGKRGLIILDRDGVINRDSKDFVKNANEWIPLDGSIEAIADLSRAGFTVAIASNQSGLARGLFDPNALEAMHSKLNTLVKASGGAVDRIVVCPHGPDDDCRCRKPRPGLIEDLLEHYKANAGTVPVVGDSLRDLQAAVAAGARPVLVLTGNGRTTAANLTDDIGEVETFVDLSAFAASLLENDS